MIFSIVCYTENYCFGRLLDFSVTSQSLPDPWRTPRWVLSPSSMSLRGLMSVLLSMILYSSWSQNARGSGDGKRSFYDWHLLKPEKEEKEVFNQQFLRWLISEKKNHIANYFRETKFSNSWWLISVRNNNKVANIGGKTPSNSKGD